MCTKQVQSLGKEAPVDGWEDFPIYRHAFDGVVIRTHRTYRTSPAGWVWAVIIGDRQQVTGYAPTQRQALQEAAHRISGQCGYVPRHRADGFSADAHRETDYAGRHSTGRLAAWARAS